MEGAADYYAGAKVVVLGDAGVGKTALTRALLGEPFAPTDATHRRQIGCFGNEIADIDGVRVRREILLWDPGGYPGYSVLHPLALGGTDLALIVFNPDRVDEPTHVRGWIQSLRSAEANGRLRPPARVFVVAARSDVKPPSRARKRILELASELGIDGYFQTSARSGDVAELRDAIRAAIPWQDLPVVETTARTHALLDELDRRRVEGELFVDARRLDGAELRTAVAIEQRRGRVHSLIRGGVLLRPELLDAYANALLLAARSDAKGLGALPDVLALVRHRSAGMFADLGQDGTTVIAQPAAPPEEQRLIDLLLIEPAAANRLARTESGERASARAPKQRLLGMVLDELIDREIAIRVATPERSYVVFPSQVEPPRDELAPVENVAAAFRFDGNASRMLATLTVALGYSSAVYSLRERWRNAATFVAAAGGLCGLRLQVIAGSATELTVFYDGVASVKVRTRFARAVREHLERHAVPDSVTQRRIVECPSCGYVFPERVVAARLGRSDDSVVCPVCETRISLDAPAASALPSRYFDVFLSHSPDDKEVVRELSDQLSARGLRPWVDQRESSLDDIADALGRVSAIAICIGSRRLHEWDSGAVHRLIDAYVHEVAMPMFVVLLPGADPDQLPSALQRTARVDMRARGSTSAVDELALFIRIATAPAKGTPISRELVAKSPLGVTRDDVREVSDALEIQRSLDRGGRRDLRRIAMAIAHRLRATNPVVLAAPPLPSSSAWDIELPVTGLRISRAILVVLPSADGSLLDEATRQDALASSLVLCADLDDALITARVDRGSATLVRLGSRELRELTELVDGQVAGWLGRLITQQVDIEPMLPYRAAGATTLFFGRDDELKRLIGEGRRGGIILGVHQSGKSSLLRELKRRLERDRMVVGPITLADNLDGFYEHTLEPLEQPLDDVTPTRWARRIRAFAKARGAPVFLLDEVDWLVRRDADTGYKLGSAMRALQQDAHADFYLAGHLDLRAATRRYGSPLRNFADEVVLTGLARAAAMRLIREPIQGIGFEISEDQADRIFRGTAGMAALIQELCGRLLTGLRGGQGNVISDDLIAHVEDSPSYLDRVFQYFYNYDENAVSRALFLLTAVARQVSRTSIAELLREHKVTIGADRIDASLSLLASFGILDQREPGEYRIPGRYLQHALAVRGDLDALLAQQVAGLRKGRGR